LLTADSLGVEKVQENGFIRLPGGGFGFGQIIQPTDIQGHDNSSFSEKGLCLQVAKT